MNCQDFETIIVEIARNRLMDAAARERGLAHAETCEACAALLAEERALSERLNALSVEVTEEEIPVNLEVAVLAAFRQNIAAAQVKPAVPASTVNRRWLLAAAAAILLTLGISLAAWFASATKTDPVAVTPSPEPIVLPPVKTTDQDKNIQPQRQELASVRTNLMIRDPKPETSRKRTPRSRGNSRPTRNEEVRELVTQFYPINQASELIPLEGGQILRVRMPRSNLIPLGIPINQERVDETVQADVLVSNDGLARAIRLVY